jgi:hypothetical protein
MQDDRQVHFIGTCPKGHGPAQSFSELNLQRALNKGELVLWCVQCGESWEATEQERENLKRRLAEGVL